MRRWWWAWRVLAGGAVAGLFACQGPDALSGWPASIVARSSISQPGLSGSRVNDPPSVQLLDPDGHPISGAKVTFTQTVGSGPIVGAEATTGSDGVATLASWSVTSGTNGVVASIPAPFRVPPVTFTATGQAPAYNIDLIFITPTTPARQATF